MQVSSPRPKRGSVMPYSSAMRVEHRHVAAAGEQPLEDQLPRAAHPVGLGEHLDAVGDGVVAGRHQAHAAPHVHLDGADAADAVRLDQRVVAERRDLHPDLLRHLDERRAVFGLGLDAVYRDCHELHRGLQQSGTGRYARSTASRLHASTQAPHLMHRSWFSRCGYLTWPVMAPVEQAVTQAWHPSHFAWSISYVDERLAHAGRAPVLPDVRVVLVAEVAQRRDHRVGRRRSRGRTGRRPA